LKAVLPPWFSADAFYKILYSRFQRLKLLKAMEDFEENGGYCYTCNSQVNSIWENLTLDGENIVS